MMKTCAAIVTVYVSVSVIMTALLRWHVERASPWRRVPASAWEQLAAQMRHGRRPAPLDATMVLADLAEWLSEREK
jgi:hypothetical protein